MKNILIPILVVLHFLVLIGCTSEDGNYFVDGQYVLAASGRNYLICETDTEETWFVLLNDASQEKNVFDGIESGSHISVKTAGVISENEISHDVGVTGCSRKKHSEIDNVPIAYLEEIEQLDEAYSNYSAEGKLVIASSGRKFLIYETNDKETIFVLLYDETMDNTLSEVLEDGSTIEISPKVFHLDGATEGQSYYAYISECNLVSSGCEESIAEDYRNEIDRIDALYVHDADVK